MRPLNDGRVAGGPMFAVHAAISLSLLILFSDIVFHPTDILYSPQSDILALHHPFRSLQIESLHERGRPQLWNPTSFGGMPLIGDPQAGIAYPPNWLHAIGPADASHAWFGWGLLLHLFVGGAGMIVWLRDHGFRRESQLAGALSFVLASKWICHVVVPGHIVFLPLVWVPWQCVFIDRIVRAPGARNCAAFAAVSALVTTGMHPQLLFYSQLEVLGYGALVLWLRLRAPAGADASSPTHAFLGLAGACALALALSAVHLLPIVALMSEFVRSEGVEYAIAAQHAILRDRLLELVVPIGGVPENWESSTYLGAASLALASFALWHAEHRAKLLFWLGSALACLWFAFGEAGGLHRVLHESVPGFSLFRFPNRMLLLIGLPLGFLVAAGVEVIAGAEIRRGRVLLALLVAELGLALLLVIPTPHAAASAAALALPAGALAVRRWGRASLAAPLLVLGLFVDQARYVMPLVETRPLEEALGDHPLVQRLRAPLGQQRVLSINPFEAADISPLPVTYGTLSGIESVRGFNPLVPKAAFRWFHEGVGARPPGWKTAPTLESFPLVRRTPLDLMNVRWLVSPSSLDMTGVELRETLHDVDVYHFQRPSAFTRFAAVYLYENTRALPRAALLPRARSVADADEALAAIGELDPFSELWVEGEDWTRVYPEGFRPVVVEHEGDRIRMNVDAGQGGYLFLSEFGSDGWRAQVDGQAHPIARANGFFQALELGAGRHAVVFEFWPRSLTIGLWISTAALLTALGLALRPPRPPTPRLP